MTESILLVDDEEKVLRAVHRLFLDYPLPVLLARNGNEALDLIERNEVAVVLTDQKMPGMTGVEFLERVTTVSPDTVKMLMTGYGDLSTAMEAINRGGAFKFILKPWDDEALFLAIEEAVKRYRLGRQMKREDDSVFESLGEAIELKDPYTKGHCERVAGYALRIAHAVNCPSRLFKEIQFGSWLHDCGKIGVPESILNFGGPVAPADFDVIREHPTWGAKVARKARMSDAIINIILCHHERFDGRGYPAGLAGTDIPLEARIVAVADVFDALTSDRPYRKAYPFDTALSMLDEMKGNILDPALVDAFIATVTMNGTYSSEDGGPCNG